MYQVDILPSIKDAKELFEQIQIKEPKLQFFLSYEWFALFEEFIVEHDGHCTYLLALFEGSKPLALLPLYGYAGSFGTKTLASMANYYTPIYDVICDESSLSKKQALSTIFKEKQSFFNSFDKVEFQPLAESSCELYRALTPSSRFRATTFFKHINWFHQFSSYEQLQSAFSSRLKNTIRRKTRKLYAESDVEFKVTTEPVDVLEKLEHYEAIYNDSWKVPEPYYKFIRQIVGDAASKGQLRLGTLTVEGEFVAAQIWFVVEKEAYIFKLAYKRDHKKLSVGTILTAKMFEYCSTIDDVTMIDFLSGDDAFKRDWMTENKSLIGIQWANMLSLKGFVIALANTLTKVKKALSSGSPSV